MKKRLAIKAMFQIMVIIVAYFYFAMQVGAAGEVSGSASGTEETTPLSNGEDPFSACGTKSVCIADCKAPKGCTIDGKTYTGKIRFEGGAVMSFSPAAGVEASFGGNTYRDGAMTCTRAQGKGFTCNGITGTVDINGASINGVSGSLNVAETGAVTGSMGASGGKISYFNVGPKSCFNVQTKPGAKTSPSFISVGCGGNIDLSKCVSADCKGAMNNMRIAVGAGSGSSATLPDGTKVVGGEVKRNSDGSFSMTAGTEIEIPGAKPGNIPVRTTVNNPTTYYPKGVPPPTDIDPAKSNVIARMQESGKDVLLYSGKGIHVDAPVLDDGNGGTNPASGYTFVLNGGGPYGSVSNGIIFNEYLFGSANQKWDDIKAHYPPYARVQCYYDGKCYRDPSLASASSNIMSMSSTGGATYLTKDGDGYEDQCKADTAGATGVGSSTKMITGMIGGLGIAFLIVLCIAALAIWSESSKPNEGPGAQTRINAVMQSYAEQYPNCGTCYNAHGGSTSATQTMELIALNCDLCASSGDCPPALCTEVVIVTNNVNPEGWLRWRMEHTQAGSSCDLNQDNSQYCRLCCAEQNDASEGDDYDNCVNNCP